MSESLTRLETSDLADCELTIEAGQQSFIDVGRALLKIRDSRLYRASHATFESYCKTRWGIERRMAYRLMDGSEVVKNLCPTGHIPATERVTRPLTKLEPEQQRDAWAKANEKAAAEDRPVTAKDVHIEVIDIERPKRDYFKMPDRGMFLAQGALSTLKQILPKDGERTKAITLVRDWCNEQLNTHEQ